VSADRRAPDEYSPDERLLTEQIRYFEARADATGEHFLFGTAVRGSNPSL
jgi:hypothetical protein